MSLSSIGCCCGLIVGFIVSTIIAIVVGVGIYFYLNPEAKNSSVKTIEKSWDNFKSASEDFFDDITENKVKPSVDKAEEKVASISKSTESFSVNKTHVEKIKDDFGKIYKNDFFADNKSSSSKEKVPKIPKSNSGDFWR